MRTRSMLALVLVVLVVAACGGGGAAVESAGRAAVVNITIGDCGGTPGAILNGQFYKVTLARDNLGGMMSPAEIFNDAQGTATLLSPQQAKFTSATGQTTATLTLQSGPLPSC